MRLTTGELADKLTILRIKQHLLGGVGQELAQLEEEWLEITAAFSDKELDRLLASLEHANNAAWDCVEKINADFSSPYFGTEEWDLTDPKQAQACIKNYRRAYDLNKNRVWLKNEINKLTQHPIEKKSWSETASVASMT